jgi:hypothetical protein
VVNAQGAAIRAFGAPDLRNTARGWKKIGIGLLQCQPGIGKLCTAGNARFQIPWGRTIRGQLM